ncbi:MAG TPA: agmatinase [Cyanobacteria bacterium UBA8530]|nr:agmatinase [Cyanobacteria bacterium UBA8530]
MEALKSNFFGLPEGFSGFENSKAVILPVPYEGTTSYGAGTKEGPAAILAASRQVELYDEELDCSPYEVGIFSAEEMCPSRISYQVPIDQTKDLFAQVLEKNKFPIMLGGEHSITLGGILAAREKYPDLCVVQIDAHADLRIDYEESPHSHACVMRRVVEKSVPLLQIGIRNISQEEMDFWKKERPSEILWGKDMPSWDIQAAIGKLSRHVYLTIDLDGIDPSEMAAVGTPEPGGISWYRLLGILRELFESREVVAADIVELCPIPGFRAPDFLAAKLLYKLIGYRFFSR